MENLLRIYLFSLVGAIILKLSQAACFSHIRTLHASSCQLFENYCYYLHTPSNGTRFGAQKTIA